MLTVLSVVTAVKDYVEIVHKLMETDSSSVNFDSILTSYSNFGTIVTYFVLVAKQLVIDFFSLHWLQSVYALPTIVPNIASAMIAEISVLDGYFHNAFTFLETPISYGNQNFIFYGLEKFSIGLLNSVFLVLPTSTAHLICLRRFVMQGLEAGYIAGLGIIAGNVVWIGSLTFGLRFLVIPWLSLDIFRYSLGFILLVKYMWDSYSERRIVLEDLSKRKIFLLNFLLAFTEQTNIYPFLSNLSISSDSTFVESFPTESYGEFIGIHSCYLLGIIVGSFSLLQLTCWFWENPAFDFYMKAISSIKVTSGLYYKVLNFVFLYLTMICAISSVSYFALDYTVTNPLGFVHEDRLFDQKGLLETSFLNSKASDRNTRRNRGRHGRRERWKRRVRRYRTFDASLYDQGVYDLFTIEDLNYGFDRFWLRRKMRNHRVHFRFFPGPWMRSFKKQLSRPRLESFMGPRVEFFRILFEQVYHPEFHEFNKNRSLKNAVALQTANKAAQLQSALSLQQSIYVQNGPKTQKQGLIKEYSALRKFIRKVNTRIKSATILSQSDTTNPSIRFIEQSTQPLYAKKWKYIFSKMAQQTNNSRMRSQENLFRRLYNNVLLRNSKDTKSSQALGIIEPQTPASSRWNESSKKRDSLERLSKKDRQILRYKTFLNEKSSANLLPSNVRSISNKNQNVKTIETLSTNTSGQAEAGNFLTNNAGLLTSKADKNQPGLSDIYKPLTLLHPLKFYLKREQAFQRKLKFYGANIYRTFSVENNAPYFRTMMKRFFHYYKPTLRWERTMRTATMRKARRKGPRVVRKLNVDQQAKGLAMSASNNQDEDETGFSRVLNSTQEGNLLQKPTHFYSLVSKRASRYRAQIYKDVLQHWYYSPFNRLMLKFDVDSFIRRQPTAHFLTKQDEQLLHLRRFLLSEHYETLRWYTYMQHYRSMKARIGGTKSFASGTYSQQFMGTFKKVRHLFALTPSSSDNTILKFDQPLYNEYSNSPTKSILTDTFLHEELLADDDLFIPSSGNPSSSIDFKVGDDLTGQSTKIVRDYLLHAKPLREKIIQNLLKDQNYWEFTKFMFKGQKTRGTSAVTNERQLLIQEKSHLYTNEEKRALEQKQTEQFQTFFNKKTTLLDPSYTGNSANLNQYKNSASMMEFQQRMWIELLKKCQNTLYDQESLKTYLLRNVDKRKKQQKRQEKYLTLRLERLKDWFSPLVKNSSPESSFTDLTGVTTAIQKGMKESLLYQKGLPNSSLKSNIRNNMPRFDWSSNSKLLKNHLDDRAKAKQLQVFEIEQDLKKSLNQKTNFQLSDANMTILESSMAQTSSLTSGEGMRTMPRQSKSLFVWIHRTVTPFIHFSKRAVRALVLQPLSMTKQLFSSSPEAREELNLQSWRKQEIALTKRKKTRKTLKRLRNTNQRNAEGNFSVSKDANDLLNARPLRQKRDPEDQMAAIETQRRVKSWGQWARNANTLHPTTSVGESGNFIDIFQNWTAKKFKRKRSRLRRYRRLRSRGPIKKRTLAEKLKRQFKLLKRYSRNSEAALTTDLNRVGKKMEIFKLITKRKYEPQSEFLPRETKQRRTRMSKQRFWKQKKQKFAQNKRKQRKRRRYAAGKIRNLFKEYKRKESTSKIRKWWWENFLPSFRATVDTDWQLQTDQQIRKTFGELSETIILERDLKNTPELQIGDKDYKPLAVPQALRIRKNLENQGLLTFNSASTTSPIDSLQETLTSGAIETPSNNLPLDLVGQMTQNTLRKSTGSLNIQSKQMVSMNPIPFYAGWDETLRKFVVTNRFLSVPNQQMNSVNTEFDMAPLKGMNAATTLYWQVPFTTYDPDQFFALGMDGFSPIGWRNFHFRHSNQTTKPILVQTKTQTLSSEKSGSLSHNLYQKLIDSPSFKTAYNSSIKNELRRSQKRYKRVKKHPRPPVWFPSGPLTNQVLPVHYIYVFYKRYRLPRDRYIRRRLRKENKSMGIQASFTKYTDFTLRKRAKPRRKYHRKRHFYKNENLVLRRRAFRGFVDEADRDRPTPPNFIAVNDGKQKRKMTTKQSSENLRIRQLRRRVQRQVLRPIWRYRPRAGGYTWPGDYLRLELVKAPILNVSPLTAGTQKSDTKSRKTRKKKRRTIQEWQVQPKKYLLQKHNLKVLRKRLEKAQNSHKLFQRSKELSYLLSQRTN